MMSFRATGLVVVSTVIFAASAAHAGSHAKDGAGDARAAIEAANLKFGAAFERGDAKALAAMYTKDAIAFPPDSDMVKGNEAIGEFWRKSHEGGVKSATLTTIDVGTSGDIAYETGKATLSVQPHGQEAATIAVKYVVVWKRQSDGSWKLHRDIWNSLPASH